MPDIVQQMTYVNPLRYFLIILRGVFLEGDSYELLFNQYWPMAIISFVTLAVAGWLFQHRMNWNITELCSASCPECRMVKNSSVWPGFAILRESCQVRSYFTYSGRSTASGYTGKVVCKNKTVYSTVIR